MPARTVDGVLFKARVARWCFRGDEDEIARHLASEAKESPATAENMGVSILLDLARMVGTTAAAASGVDTGAASNLRAVSLPAALSARHFDSAAT